MVPVCRQSGHMVQVRTAMERLMAAMECLMAAGVAEALVLAEVSVEAEAGAVVAVEADAFGSRFKLAINSLGVNCRKDEYYAKR